MTEIKDIKINQESIDKIIEWKSNLSLCDMIMSNPTLLNTEQAKTWIKSNSEDGNQLLLGIYYNNILEGIVRLMFIDSLSGTGEVGIYLGNEANRGKGLGKHALHMITLIARNKRNLSKLYARIRFKNKPSIKLFKSQGFFQEGLLRNHYKSKINESYDHVLYFGKFLK